MDEVKMKELLEEQNRLIKSLREKVEAGESRGKNMLKESTEAIEALSKRLDTIEFDELKKNDEAMNRRLDDIEVKFLRPMQDSLESKKAKTEQEQKEAFVATAYNKFLRKGDKNLTVEEIKALSVDQDPQGGYMVPVTRSRELVKKLIEFSPVRELATVVRISAGDLYEEPVEGTQDFAGSWVGERGARTETTAAKLNLEKIPVHELFAQPFVTQKMLDDSEFDVEAWLNERIAMRFAVLEGTGFISGDGVNKPEGMLTHAGVTQVVSGHASQVTGDGLVDLVYALPEFYARNATFLLKRATLGLIRKLKDSSGNYLWAPGMGGNALTANLSAGAPSTILDRPYREAIDMPTVAANAYPILFGDFRSAYRIVDRVDVRQIRDPYTNKPHVSFYTTKRTGGQVVLAEAIVKQKIST